jgi:uncharacterized membrane protein
LVPSADEIVVETAAEESSVVNIVVRNTLDEAANLTVTVSPELAGLVVVPQGSIVLGGGSKAALDLKVVAPPGKKAGKYVGFVTLSDGKTEMRVPVKVSIESPMSALGFQVRPLVPSTKPGERVPVELSISYSGKQRRTKILLAISLVQVATGETVSTHEEELEVMASVSLARYLGVPQNASHGRYAVEGILRSIAGEAQPLQILARSDLEVEGGIALAKASDAPNLIIGLLAAAAVGACSLIYSKTRKFPD